MPEICRHLTPPFYRTPRSAADISHQGPASCVASAGRRPDVAGLFQFGGTQCDRVISGVLRRLADDRRPG